MFDVQLHLANFLPFASPIAEQAAVSFAPDEEDAAKLDFTYYFVVAVSTFCRTQANILIFGHLTFPSSDKSIIP
jgi:hypothetical protein